MKRYKFQRCRKKKRSKLEMYLVNRLRAEHSWLLLEECNRTILEFLELDIFLPQFNIAIEINGKMHYEFVEYFHHTQKNFQKQRIRDRQKRLKCQELGIQLIEIPNLKTFSLKNAESIYQWLIGVLKQIAPLKNLSLDSGGLLNLE